MTDAIVSKLIEAFTAQDASTGDATKIEDRAELAVETIRAALTATPAQRTPSGEVDGLVAEIDALEKAYFDIPETEITENPQIYVLDPEIFQFLGKIADFLSAFDKALPKLRTALGGGWRDTESDSFESEPSICGYTPPQIEGET